MFFTTDRKLCGNLVSNSAHVGVAWACRHDRNIACDRDMEMDAWSNDRSVAQAHYDADIHTDMISRHVIGMHEGTPSLHPSHASL